MEPSLSCFFCDQNIKNKKREISSVLREGCFRSTPENEP